MRASGSPRIHHYRHCRCRGRMRRNPTADPITRDASLSGSVSQRRSNLGTVGSHVTPILWFRRHRRPAARHGGVYVPRWRGRPAISPGMARTPHQVGRAGARDRLPAPIGGSRPHTKWSSRALGWRLVSGARSIPGRTVAGRLGSSTRRFLRGVGLVVRRRCRGGVAPCAVAGAHTAVGERPGFLRHSLRADDAIGRVPSRQTAATDLRNRMLASIGRVAESRSVAQARGRRPRGRALRSCAGCGASTPLV
jgi:hypothetical protein